MFNKKNKVKYGLSNVHTAVQKIDVDGAISYEDPVPVPGAVNISLTAQGEISPFYADNGVYFQTASNNGYEGDLEIALVPEHFRIDILGEEKDEDGVLVENANVISVPFALLFEFIGDVKKIKHVLYNCVATRPSIESGTREESIEPQTDTLSLSAAPLETGHVKAKTGDTTPDEVHENWYKSVRMPKAPDPDQGTGQ